jgi:hypothetical protein
VLFRRFPLAQGIPEFTRRHEDAREANDQLVSRLSRMLEIHPANPGYDWSRGLPDDFHVNLMLRLVNEDKTSMDINQALDFFERNGLAINKRWQQLRKNNGIGTSKYQDYLVPRFAFPKPKIGT